MNDFLNQVWLDNTVKSYLLVLCIILATFLIKKYIARYIAGFIFNAIKNYWKEVDKQNFRYLLVKPLSSFLLVLITVTSLHSLLFPQVLNVEIYRVTLKEVIHFTGTILLIVFFIKLLINILEFMAILAKMHASYTPGESDDQVVIFFKDLIKALLLIIGLLLTLKYAFGFKIATLLTSLSLVSAAVAFAMRESIENLIASFIIFFDRPFTLGDTVKVQGFTGVVEKIGLRSTKVRTDQKTYITVPNKQMVDSIIDNLSLRTQRRADIKIELAASNKQEVVAELLDDIKQILLPFELQNTSVNLADIQQASYLILAEFYTSAIPMAEFNQIKEKINLEIIQLLQQKQVTLYHSVV